jgi:hypothetical protein
MYFPWVGMLEQIKLADIFVHYDDVQYSKGSFTNRVQVKTQNGIKWLTVPLRSLTLGQKIIDVTTHDPRQWASKHRSILAQAYSDSPHSSNMLSLFDEVIEDIGINLVEISRKSMMAIAGYYGLLDDTQVYDSSCLNIAGSGSKRVLDIVQYFGGDVYVTGHGAMNYLDHELFEKNNIEVQYMDYKKTAYPQLHGLFNPYVTSLDLIANCGLMGKEYIHSGTVNWREFNE